MIAAGTPTSAWFRTPSPARVVLTVSMPRAWEILCTPIFAVVATLFWELATNDAERTKPQARPWRPADPAHRQSSRRPLRSRAARRRWIMVGHSAQEARGERGDARHQSQRFGKQAVQPAGEGLLAPALPPLRYVLAESLTCQSLLRRLSSDRFRSRHRLFELGCGTGLQPQSGPLSTLRVVQRTAIEGTASLCAAGGILGMSV